MKAFNKGVQIKKLGYSIDYNPCKHKEIAEDYGSIL